MNEKEIREAKREFEWALKRIPFNENEQVDIKATQVSLKNMQTLAALAEQVLSAEMPEKKNCNDPCEICSKRVTGCRGTCAKYDLFCDDALVNETIDQCRLWNAKRPTVEEIKEIIKSKATLRTQANRGKLFVDEKRWEELATTIYRLGDRK